MTSNADTQPVDPVWWRAVVAKHETSAYPSMFSLAQAFLEAASECPDASMQRRTLDTIGRAATTRLQVTNWNDPFSPMWPSDLPAGLTPEQFALLQAVAAATDDSDHPALRARLCDLCWWYGDRRNTMLRDAAVTSYIAIPLEQDGWHRDGADALGRVIEILRRLGESGRAHAAALASRVHGRLLTIDLEDRYFASQLSRIAREQRLINKNLRADLAERSAAFAATARKQRDWTLEQAWEDEAAGWYALVGDKAEATAAAARRAMSFISEAEDRRIGVGGSANSAGHFVELALRALLTLPRAYRAQRGIDQQIAALREQLRDDRLAVLESMRSISSEPLDISEYVAYAQGKVAGLEPVDALIALGTLHQIASFDRAVERARKTMKDFPLSHLLGEEFYSSTGQKLASTAGMSSTANSGRTPTELDSATWAAMIRDHNTMIGLVVPALIAPAYEVISLEHQYSAEMLFDLCRSNPWLPNGHQATWAFGLLHGLNGDFLSSATVLVPQIEHFVRTHLKERGVHTVVTDEHGVETEKGLGTLLDEPLSIKTLGPDLVFEMKAILTDQRGPNFRNVIAHGMNSDGAIVSAGVMYIWWLAVHLVIRPHAIQQAADQNSGHPSDNSSGGSV